VTTRDSRHLSTMRAGVFAGARTVDVVDVPVPAPGPGEVRLRVEGCGVCGSDLPVWEGRPWFAYPRPAGAPGHETWGYVDAVGAGVTNIRPGERVAGLSTHGYAQYDVVGGDRLLRLSGIVDEHQPFPGEPLACAVNVFRRAGIRAGDDVAVIGIGFLGAVIAQLAVRAQARVICVARRQEARDLAMSLGAVAAVAFEPAPRIVRELTGERMCDVTVEATGAQAPLDLAGELTRVRGRLVIAGYHQDGPRQVDMQLWNWRGLDVINAHERDPEVYLAGMRRAARAIAAGRLDPTALYTHHFSLEQLDEALAAVGDGDRRPFKALVYP
jgi:threonine dehydrogenase-like Zn-dependent dehydrogenase